MRSIPQNTHEELETLIRAKYPILYIWATEERRVEDILRDVAARRHKHLYGWTMTEGVVDLLTPKPVPVAPRVREPLHVLDYVDASDDAAIFVLKDFHPFIDSQRFPLETAATVRRLRDIAASLKESRKTLVLLSPVVVLPPELEKDITLLDFSLPTITDLAAALDRVLRSARQHGSRLRSLHLRDDEREAILRASSGLTCTEAENVFAKSIVLTGTIDVDIISREKQHIIRKSRVLEYFEPNADFSHVGGMGELKEWLRKRAHAFSERARAFGLPEPRGLLLLGVQGSGKSLMAKAIASQWHLPLLRLDMGRIFGELVGASEHNIRHALRVAESIAPCVLWLDELEKGLAGAHGGRSDAGTAARVFATFLTWMQEKEAPVFVVATSNDIRQLPSETLRKGRFDEIFFVDLPTEEERAEIWAIHLRKRKRNPDDFDIERLAADSEDFSGAEIEQVVISALYDAFDEGRDVQMHDLLRNLTNTVPLAHSMREEISRLREWARTNARPASSCGWLQPWELISES
nr:AAA family ATPase [Ardenticatena sp.]